MESLATSGEENATGSSMSRSGIVPSVPTTPSARRSRRAWFAGAVIATGIGMAGAWASLVRARAPVTAADVPTASSPAARLVRVVVDPSVTSVEVDGARAAIVEGSITMSGNLGSTHLVRARGATGVLDLQVVIAETGAVPDRIGVAPPPVVTASAPAPSAATPGATAHPALPAAAAVPRTVKPAASPAASQAPKPKEAPPPAPKKLDVSTTLE
jgi:hypothetical protein